MNWRVLMVVLLVLLVILVSVFFLWRCFSDDGIKAGSALTLEAGGVSFTLRYVPAATFPTGLDDDGEAVVEHPFWMGETEVSYELWYQVRTWAEENGYIFANRGAEGSYGPVGEEPSEDKNLPVTWFNWYDAVVWCNALSEYLDYTPVYTFQGQVYRDATDRSAGSNLTARKVQGFRLPTTDEWELAARYRGRDRSHGAIEYPPGSRNYWSPGNYASGAKGPISDEEATMEAAWYAANSAKDDERALAQPVGQKPPGGNALNIFDMSGNVFEWLHFEPGERPASRGGSFVRGVDDLAIGDPNPRGGPNPRSTYHNMGLRVVLSLEEDPDLDPDDPGDKDPPDDDPVWEPEFEVASLVEVEWDGSWYKAEVLDVDVENQRYFITYDGYDSSWDEWVDETRIRARSADLVVVDVQPAYTAVDQGTAAWALNAPPEVQVLLSDGSTFWVDVLWDLEDFDSSTEGEVELTGTLVSLPPNLGNPDEIKALLVVRVRDEEGSTSVVRMGSDTQVDDLLFYIQYDYGVTGYYFGTNPQIDLTHIVLERNGAFAGVIIFDENMLPLQWVLPELTVSVLTPRDEEFDPSDVVVAFLVGDDESSDQINLHLDIEMNMAVSQVLDKMLDLYGSDFAQHAAHLQLTLGDMGWLDKEVGELAALAATPREVAYASSLTAACVSLGIMEQVEDLTEEQTSRCPESPEFTLLCTGNVSGRNVADAVLGQMMGKFGPIYDMMTYLERIASGYYSGGDIQGPSVSMLLCRGVSCVPGVCHQFYMPNTPGNVSKCVARCKTSMACFTDICHPKSFSAQDALGLRGP